MSLKDKINKIISKIEFHDLPLEKVSLDFENEKLTLLVAIHDDEFQDYLFKSVEFIGVSEFDKDCRISIDIEEICYLDIVPVSENEFSAKIIFLTGFSKPSIEWKFRFKDLKVENL